MRSSDATCPRIRRSRIRRAPTPNGRSRRRIARRRRFHSDRHSPRRSRSRADRRRRSIRRRPSKPITGEGAIPVPKNRAGASLAREFRMDQTWKHQFLGFPRDDFAQTAWIFWQNGYRSVGDVRDVGPNGAICFFEKSATRWTRMRSFRALALSG